MTTIVSPFVAMIYHTSVFYFSRGTSISVLLVIFFKRSKRATSTDMSKLVTLVVSIMRAVNILMLSAITHFTIIKLR